MGIRYQGAAVRLRPFLFPPFLLLNLPTGSIINNYQNIREEQRKDKAPDRPSEGC
ncbi:MAG: hypothetical protein IKN78_10160 [Bacteroidales bacterium]|nr:hypothetical protein [Bacteroidales bacterium]